MIANEVREAAVEQLESVLQLDSITTVYEAETPTGSLESSGGGLKKAVVAGFVGAVLVCAVLALVYIVQGRICTEDDVERYLGLRTLGAIPRCESLCMAAPAPAAVESAGRQDTENR